MKTTKLVLGIISLVLPMIIMFQSCAAGMYNAIESNGEVSGTAGFLLAVCLIVAGIVGIATRNKGNGGAFTAGGFYMFGGLIGLMTAGSYGDLYIWATLSIGFGLVFIVGTIVSSKKMRKLA